MSIGVTVTTEEAAEYAGVTPAVIRQWVIRGKLAPVRRGAKPLRFDYDDVARAQREARSAGWHQRHDQAAEEWSASASGGDVSR